MDEIELKFLEIDKKKYISILKKLKAKKKFNCKIKAIYFDTKDSKLKKQNKILRLRKINNYHELTFKKKINNKKFKHVKEYEIKINNPKELKKILKELGYEPFTTIEKQRISYEYKNSKIEIDTIKNCPTYLEIEVNDKNKLKKIIDDLKLDIKKGKNWSMFEVIKKYKK